MGKLYESFHHPDALNLRCAQNRVRARSRDLNIRLQRRRRGCIQHVSKCNCARKRTGSRRTEQKVRRAVPSQLVRRRCRITLELSRFAHWEALRVIPPPRCTKKRVARTTVFGLVLEIRQFVCNGVVAAALSIPQSASVHGRDAVCGGPSKRSVPRFRAN